MRTLKICLLFILPLIFLTACGPEDEGLVREKALGYLNEKYGDQGFKITHVNQYFNGGNMSQAVDILATSTDLQGMDFQVHYSGKNQEVRGDEYKKARWEKELSQMAGRKLPLCTEVSCALYHKKHNLLYSSDLPNHPNLRKWVDAEERPSAELELRFDAPANRAWSSISTLNKELMEMGFDQLRFKLDFYPLVIDGENFPDEPERISSIEFKQTVDLPMIDSVSFIGLQVFGEKDTTFKRNIAWLNEADTLLRQQDTLAALEFYHKILDQTSLYRSDVYFGSENACRIESAWKLGEIAAARGEDSTAKMHFQFILDLLAFEGAPLKWADYGRNAERKLGLQK